MIIRTLLITATALSLVAMPAAMAQTKKTETESTGHHYSGGPRNDPHHMGKKDTGVTTGKAGPRGSHHYSGGPRADPHHMGPK